MVKVLYGGIFDLVHAAHVHAIKRAKTLGDYLVIHVGSDHMAKWKGADRPTIPGEDRAFIISQLKDVDEVVYHPNDTVVNLPALLDLVKPDTLVLNEGERKYNEDEECAKRGIKIVDFPRFITKSGLDTTKIINKIKKRR